MICPVVVGNLEGRNLKKRNQGRKKPGHPSFAF
jgi:hypothetical protein